MWQAVSGGRLDGRNWQAKQAEGCRPPPLKINSIPPLPLTQLHHLPLQKQLQWANALLVVAVEQLLGADCDKAAQAFHIRSTEVRRERSWPGATLWLKRISDISGCYHLPMRRPAWLG